MYVGIPAVPISTYAKASGDFAKFRLVIELMRPKLVYMDDASKCAGALRAVDLGEAVFWLPPRTFRTEPRRHRLKT